MAPIGKREDNMSDIITVSREFGSGGRELAKRLSEEMGYQYFDREILEKIRQKLRIDQWYTEKIVEGVLQVNAQIHYGGSFDKYVVNGQRTEEGLTEHQVIMKELAAMGKCVFVGRGANVVLHSFSPFNLFVYASMDAKIVRCHNHASLKENYSETEYEAIIQTIDAVREQTRQSVPSSGDEDIEGYHLCVNTSGLEIKELVPIVADYAKYWLKEEKYKNA